MSSIEEQQPQPPKTVDTLLKRKALDEPEDNQDKKVLKPAIEPTITDCQANDSNDSNEQSLLDHLTDQTWKKELEAEFKKEYFRKLLQFLGEEEKRGIKIFPPKDEIFTAFNLTPLDQIKVVIIGQDPYHDDGQAHGLCFSVKPGIPVPPSLKNVYKELGRDIEGFKSPSHGYLAAWAKRGVFMLNAILTVQAHKPSSHSTSGWQTFTDAVIRIINTRCKGVVFLLWGAFAKSKSKLITEPRHKIIACGHPSPISTVDRWSGCSTFSKANDALESFGKEPINWLLPMNPNEPEENQQGGEKQD